MSRTAKIVAIVLASILALCLIVSCNQRQYVAVAPGAAYVPGVGAVGPAVVGAQPQVIVQQAPGYYGGSHDGFFTGMLAGHLMSGGSSHTTTIVHAPAPAPVYRAPAAPVYRPVAPSYTPRPSYTTNSRGISTSVSRGGSISVRRR